MRPGRLGGPDPSGTSGDPRRAGQERLDGGGGGRQVETLAASGSMTIG